VGNAKTPIEDNRDCQWDWSVAVAVAVAVAVVAAVVAAAVADHHRTCRMGWDTT
jgi:hypothetical protein